MFGFILSLLLDMFGDVVKHLYAASIHEKVKELSRRTRVLIYWLAGEIYLFAGLFKEKSVLFISAGYKALSLVCIPFSLLFAFLEMHPKSMFTLFVETVIFGCMCLCIAIFVGCVMEYAEKKNWVLLVLATLMVVGLPVLTTIECSLPNGCPTPSDEMLAAMPG